MDNNLTLILGASSAPARALAARILADPARRVMLVDRADPMPALLAERAPMLEQVAPSLSAHRWQSLVQEQRVTGAAIEQDVVAWMVAMLGLLRPSAIVLCAAEHEAEHTVAHHATALSALAAKLGLFFAAVDQHYQRLAAQQSAQPRLLVIVSGTLGTATDAGVAQLVDALAHELLPHVVAPPYVLLVPRLFGAGANPDPEFRRLVRQLLLGDAVRLGAHEPPHEPEPPPRWIADTEVAAIGERILTRADDGRLLEQAEGAPVTRGRKTRCIEQRGHAAELAYLALLIADELDRLMPDQSPRRASLLRTPAEGPRRGASGQQLADAVRAAVRWCAANASLLTRSA